MVARYPRLVGSTLFLVSTSVWWLLVVGGSSRVIFCCDARFYIQAAQRGFFDSTFDGYRSYLNFVVVRAISWIGHLAGLPELLTQGEIASSPAYSLAALAVFLCSGFALIAIFAKDRHFWLVFCPFYMNPVIVANIPYPLQEGQFLLIGLPLIIVCLFTESAQGKCITAGILAGSLWMTKASYLLPALAVVLYACVVIYRQRRETTPWGGAALVVAGCMLVVLPQSLHRFAASGDFMPYDHSLSRQFLRKQVTWGWATWKYATAMEDEKFSGLWTPTGQQSGDIGDTIRQARNHPATAFGIALGHVFAAFNFSPPITYLREKPSFELSGWALLSGVILFFGTVGLIQRWLLWNIAENDVLLDGIAVGTVVILPILAVESRFALPALAVLSVRGIQLLYEETNCSKRISLVVGAGLFTALFAVVSMLFAQISTFAN